MKKYIIPLLLLVATISCQHKTKFLSAEDTLSKSTTNMSMRLYELELLKEARSYESEIDGKDISLDISIFDSNGTRHRIGDVIKDRKLIFRYTELDCHVCIEEQINNLTIYADSIGVNSIMVFASYENLAYLSYFIKVNDVKFQIYNIKDETEEHIKDIGVPYFFILNPNGIITNAFIPFKEIPDHTNQYLHSMYSRYFFNHKRNDTE